jgi:hypothetical protein
LPSWTRNSSAAAAFWKPAITGCGVNLINVPSLMTPNSDSKAPASRTIENAIASTSGAPPARIAGSSECARPKIKRPRKKVLVIRGA